MLGNGLAFAQPNPTRRPVGFRPGLPATGRVQLLEVKVVQVGLYQEVEVVQVDLY